MRVTPKSLTSGGFTPGKHYSVIAVEGLDYRIVDDTGAVGSWPRRTFELSDPRVPTHWELRAIDGNSRIYASEPALSLPGFFEDIFDRVPGAEVPLLTSLSTTADEKQRFADWFRRRPWAQAERAASKGIFDNPESAAQALKRLSSNIERDGFPEGSAGLRGRSVAVPIDGGAVAVFTRRGDAGTPLKLEGTYTSAEWRDAADTGLVRRGSLPSWGGLLRGPGSPPTPQEPGAGTTRTLRVTPRAGERAPGLEAGAAYTVLEIVGGKVRVITQDSGLQFVPWTLVTPIDRRLGDGWTYRLTKGKVSLQRERFAATGYFDSVLARTRGSEQMLLTMPDLLDEERNRFLEWFFRGSS